MMEGEGGGDADGGHTTTRSDDDHTIRSERRKMGGGVRQWGGLGLGAVLLLTAAYNVLPGHGTLKTQHSKIPRRFFQWTSFVNDYYLGEIQEAFQWILESDLTFVMFYAPWDAQSMETRWEFSKAAKYFQDEVRFIAINCWWSEGECRQHFRRIHEYPVLMAFVGAGQGIQYRGVQNHIHMIEFLEGIMQPLKLVFSLGDLVNLQARHDTVVVGYFDFETSSQPGGYGSFHYAAMKALERDPHRSVCFAVVTNRRVAQQLGTVKSKSVMMIRTNETLEFSERSIFRSDVLLQWIYGNRTPIVRWLSPPKVKSRLLSAALETSSPALIMFTPRNPLSPSMPYFDLLYEVALDYYNCRRSWSIRNVIRHSIEITSRYRAENTRLEKMCGIWRGRHDGTSVEDAGRVASGDPFCCRSAMLSVFPPRRCDICAHPLARDPERRRSSACVPSLNSVINVALLVMLKELTTSRGNVCSERVTGRELEHKLVACCQDEVVSYGNVGGRRDSETRHLEELGAAVKTSSNGHSYDGADDKIHFLLENGDRALCQRWAHARRYSAVPFPSGQNKPAPTPPDVTLTGLGCRTNQTLKFLAMDTLQYGLFSQRMGVNASKLHHGTAVVIQNNQKEVQFLLQQWVTKRTLVDFIWNYTHGTLDRFLRSSPTQPDDCGATDDKICIKEVTGASFERIVMDDNEDVVLLYYAPWCGFCAGIHHIYLTVASYFGAAANLTFARINGDKNDLPWEFTVETYPTILFFPARRKSESAAYSQTVPITVTNLAYFVLANLKNETRLQMALTMCGPLCIYQNRRRLLAYVRTTLREILFLRLRSYHVQKALEKLRDAGGRPGGESLARYQRYLLKGIRTAVVKRQHARWLTLLLSTFPPGILSDAASRAVVQDFDRFKNDLRAAESADGASEEKGRRSAKVDGRLHRTAFPS